MRRFFFSRDNEEAWGYTDLAIERRRADTAQRGIEYKSSDTAVGVWEHVRIFSDDGAKAIGRPCGNYYTLSTGRLDLIGDDEIYDIAEELAKKLCKMLDAISALPERILVVGLGNRSLTPDTVGPKSADGVKPTIQIKNFDYEMFLALDCSEIDVITPGVSAECGLESVDIIKSICKSVSPSLVIAIDAIATKSQLRLGSTFQLSDTGIFPGSGVGNMRLGLNLETLGAPIISIGVPTVIDSRVFNRSMDENLNINDSGMLVAPKEIDEITDVAAKIISTAINQAFGINPY